jgi:hypothetical protein
MTRWSAITRTPPPLLRTRLRLVLHSPGGKNLNPIRIESVPTGDV